jgi:hypothetical protein
LGDPHGYADGINPEAYVIVNDKLYLNLTQGINNAWINVGKHGIVDADRYWPKLVRKMGPKDTDGNRPYWNN